MVTGSGGDESLPKAFEAGVMDFIAKPPNPIEIVARVRAALRLNSETNRRKSREIQLLEVKRKLEVANEELRRLSVKDGLTGLTNRRGFDAFLEQAWKGAIRQRTPIAVILLDIDHFKLYNDHYGHLGGDECLKRVAMAINDCVKRESDFAARYGGEEFVLVASGANPDGFAHLAEAVRANVEALGEEHSTSPTGDYVTVSVGLAVGVPNADSSASSLVALADEALYKAKEEGRNRVHARTLE